MRHPEAGALRAHMPRSAPGEQEGSGLETRKTAMLPCKGGQAGETRGTARKRASNAASADCCCSCCYQADPAGWVEAAVSNEAERTRHMPQHAKKKNETIQRCELSQAHHAAATPRSRVRMDTAGGSPKAANKDTPRRAPISSVPSRELHGSMGRGAPRALHMVCPSSSGPHSK